MKDLQLRQEIQETGIRIRETAVKLGVNLDKVEERTLPEITASLIKFNTEFERQNKEAEQGQWVEL